MIIKFSNKKAYYKTMEIRYNENSRIITPLTPRLDELSRSRIFSEISSEEKNTAINLSFVQDCTIEFISSLVEFGKKKSLSVFNIPAEIFVLFNVMNIDKIVQLYVTQEDFEKNSRQLVNRKLAVV